MAERVRAVAMLGALIHGVAGCGSTLSASTQGEPAAQAEAEPKRSAPGVVVDPTSPLPEAKGDGHSGDGVVVLREPIDVTRAVAVVRRFFDAIVNEDAERLADLLQKNAQVQMGTTGRRDVAMRYWTLRFDRLDYLALSGQRLFRDGEVETYRQEDVRSLGPKRSYGMAVPDDGVLVRVRILTTRVGKVRLFGDRVAFLLRRTDSGYKIAEMSEDFQLP